RASAASVISAIVIAAFSLLPPRRAGHNRFIIDGAAARVNLREHFPEKHFWVFAHCSRFIHSLAIMVLYTLIINQMEVHLR
ncbi:MAG: hypothetical protein RR739_06425, partial [Clostridia bacterium]